MNPSADDLITRIQTNDPACFKDIVSWYAADVLRLAYFLLQNRSEAEDVFQEAAIRLIRQSRKGALRAQNGSIKGFLMKCARNICIDRLRNQKRLPVRNEGHAQIESAVCERRTPDRELDKIRLYEALDKALKQLPDRLRITLVLFEINGESYKEIAETLNVSTEAVKKNLFRARRKLRTILAPYLEIV